MRFTLESRRVSPGLAIWQKAGIFWAYGIEDEAERGPERGLVIDPPSGMVSPADSAWELPLLHEARLETGPGTSAVVFDRDTINTSLNQNHLAGYDRLARRLGHQQIHRHLAHLARYAARLPDMPENGLRATMAMQDPHGVALIDAARQAGIPDTLIDQCLRDPAGMVESLATMAQNSDPDPSLPPMHMSFHDTDLENLLGDDAALWSRLVDYGWRQPGTIMDFGTTRQAWTTPEWQALDQHGTMAAPRATLDLESFVLADGGIDLDGLRQTITLWTIVLDIAVTAAQHKQEIDAKISHAWRPIALVPGNLAAVMMRNGLALHSPDGIKAATALTSFITATATATSIDIARRCGAYPAFASEKAAVGRILHNRALAARGARQGYAGLAILPAVTLPDDGPFADAAGEAQDVWQDVTADVASHGLRNAMLVLDLPPGPADAVLEMASHGNQPIKALVIEYPHMMGGWLRSVRPAVPAGLTALGYRADQVEKIVGHAIGYASLEHCPGVTPHRLRQHGFDDAALKAIEDCLPDVADFRAAFHPAILGDTFFRRTLGIAPELAADAGFDLLRHLDFSPAEIDAAARHCRGANDIRDAADLADIHRAIFDLDLGHPDQVRHQIDLLAALQPFYSLAADETIRLPVATTQAQLSDYYWRCWRAGLWQPRLWREGASLEAPWRAPWYQTPTISYDDHHGEWVETTPVAAPSPEPAPELERISDQKPERAALPYRRKGYTQKAIIGGHKLYLRTGEYADGRLGEIFIDMHKEGAPFRSLVNNFAVAISMGLQHGVPLSEFVEAFTFTRFDPAGPVEGNPNVTRTTSILDYIFRELAISYLGRDDLALAVPDDFGIDALGRGMQQSQLPDHDPVTISDDQRALAISMGHHPVACPICDHHRLIQQEDGLLCKSCGHRMRLDFWSHH